MPTLLQTFGLSVVLKKLVHRANSMAGATSARQTSIDLTKYLSESDSIRTVKALSQPGGGFTITFADQLATELQDTIYALVEPMDMVEIRASRTPWKFAGQPLPLILRGFVSSVQRAQQIGDDGTPQRRVVVRGIDGGKLWQIVQVLYEFLQATDNAFLDPFGMQAAIGLDGSPLAAGAYMQKLVDYLNTKIEKLAAYGKQVVPKFTLRSTVGQGQAFLQGSAAPQGALWNFVESFVDRPWNEAFVIDEEAGPVLIYRPVPFKDLAGKFIMPGAADPGSIDVSDVEVIDINVARSDARVANFFWVPPGDGTFESGGAVNAASLANAQPADTDYPNNTPTLYGEKMMTATTSLMPDAVTYPPTDLPATERASASSAYVSWYNLRGAQLKAMNRDNSLLEEGTATVNGKETLQIGRYARIQSGTLTSDLYITQLAHIFAPFRSWVSTMTLERGTGFYQRDQATNVPFWAEGRKGPYTR